MWGEGGSRSRREKRRFFSELLPWRGGLKDVTLYSCKDSGRRQVVYSSLSSTVGRNGRKTCQG